MSKADSLPKSPKKLKETSYYGRTLYPTEEERVIAKNKVLKRFQKVMTEAEKTRKKAEDLSDDD